MPGELQRLGEGDPMGPAVRAMLQRWALWLRGQPQDEATRRLLVDFERVVQDEMRKLRAEGEAEGERRGKTAGNVEGKAEALLLALGARGLAPSAAQREQIASCRDVRHIEQWLVLASTASSVDEVLASPTSAPDDERGRR